MHNRPSAHPKVRREPQSIFLAARVHAPESGCYLTQIYCVCRYARATHHPPPRGCSPCASSTIEYQRSARRLRLQGSSIGPIDIARHPLRMPHQGGDRLHAALLEQREKSSKHLCGAATNHSQHDPSADAAVSRPLRRSPHWLLL